MARPVGANEITGGNKGGAHRLAEPMVHSCGFQSWYPTGYAMHAKHCDGTVPSTEGRIAARDRALVPVSGRPRAPVVDAKTARRRETWRKYAAKRAGKVVPNGHADRTPPATNAIVEIRAAATDKAMEIVIAGLIAKRDAIDRAIAALQAVSA